MKRAWVTVSISFVFLFLLSCNNATDKDEAKKEDTTATTAATTESKPAFVPFKVVAIQHKVKNFDKAVAGYFSRDSLLRSYGIRHEVFARDMKDTNQVFAIDRVENIDSAKAFFAHPKVVETMTKAGVSRAPGYSYAEIVRYNDAPRQYSEGLSVAHHVKDYDVWLKAFDAEASDRSANGMIDRTIARDVADPNMVYVTFEISDLEKAKARMASPELKKKMEEEGVDGPPTVRWYRVVK